MRAPALPSPALIEANDEAGETKCDGFWRAEDGQKVSFKRE
jgi:hypothetical protein